MSECSNKTEQTQRAAVTPSKDAPFKGLKWIFLLKLFSLSGKMKLINVTPGKNRKE